jgi:hypothetical protein
VHAVLQIQYIWEVDRAFHPLIVHRVDPIEAHDIYGPHDRVFGAGSTEEHSESTITHNGTSLPWCWRSRDLQTRGSRTSTRQRLVVPGFLHLSHLKSSGISGAAVHRSHPRAFPLSGDGGTTQRRPSLPVILVSRE